MIGPGDYKTRGLSGLLFGVVQVMERLVNVFHELWIMIEVAIVGNHVHDSRNHSKMVASQFLPPRPVHSYTHSNHSTLLIHYVLNLGRGQIGTTRYC